MVKAIRCSFTIPDVGEGRGTCLTHAQSIETTTKEIIVNCICLVVCATFIEMFDYGMMISITEEYMTRQRNTLLFALQYHAWTVFQDCRDSDS
jgi:hypothetical protein